MTRVALGCPICVDFGKVGKPEYPEKNLEAQERSATRTPTHLKRDTPNLVSVVRETRRGSTHIGHRVAR